MKSFNNMIADGDTCEDMLPYERFLKSGPESLTDADMVILPGGMPGTNYLKASDEVKNLVNAYNDAGKYVAAICAAPTVFGEMGILQGKKPLPSQNHRDVNR